MGCLICASSRRSRGFVDAGRSSGRENEGGGGRAGTRVGTVTIRGGDATLARATRGGDGAIWVVALTTAVLLHHDFQFDSLDASGLAKATAIVLIGQWTIGSFFGLYVGRWMTGSFDELPALAYTVGAVSVILGTINALVGPPRLIPWPSAIVGGVLAFVLMGATRWLWRRLTEHGRRPHAAGRTPLLVFGAGAGGQQAVHALLRDPNTPYVPVALLDDDPKKLGLSIQGVRVIGNRADLAAASARYGAATCSSRCPVPIRS